jgi:membrane-associated phospholipid phosphatase
MIHHRPARTILIVLALSVVPSTVSAQRLILLPKFESPPAQIADDKDCLTIAESNSQVPATLPPQPRSKALSRLFGRLLADEKTMWTSPSRVTRDEIKWIVPLAAITAVMISTDKRAIAGLGSPRDFAEDSRDLSSLGSGFAAFGAAGGIYVVGKLTHNERATETGMLGVEAIIHASIVANVLKLATARERPNIDRGDGSFWDGGHSFPSGHATVIWALATVIAEEYSGKPLIRFGAYGVAAAVAAARFTGQNHFPADVLVGSALGYLIGHYIVKRHSKY